jgi:outer membrane protein insertion porin family
MILALGFLFSSLATPRSWAASDLAEVERIEIEGAIHFPADQLRDLMRTRASSLWRPFRSAPYRRDILLGDLKRIEAFYQDQGYRQVSVELIGVEPIDDGRWVLISIRIVEGPLTRVATVDFEGNHAVDRATLLETVQTAPGAAFSAARVALDRQRLLELYADEGRPYTVVADSVVIDRYAAMVTFLIREAPGTKVRNVVIEGRREVKRFVIHRELTVEPGDLLRRSQLLKSRERLLETGYFRDVRFQAVAIDSTVPPRALDLELTVLERKMGWVVAGVGYNSSKQVRLSSEVGQRNILGNAQRLVARGRLAFDLEALTSEDLPAIEESRAELSFTEPWLFGTRTVGTVTLFGEISREPEVEAVGNVTREDAWGVAIAAERRLRGRTRVRTSLENRWVTQEVQVPGVVEGDTTLVDRAQDFTVRSVTQFVERDRRDSPFDPTRGSVTSLLAEIAGGALGGTSSFFKLSLSRSWYRPFGSLVFAARARGGWIHPFGNIPRGRAVNEVPREERFRAGGATTVRGYPEDSLGPQSITEDQSEPATERGLVTIIGNLELRFPLVGPFAGAVFLDAGNVWEEAKSLSLSDFVPDWDDARIEDVRYSVGGGIRFRTPVGPLRVDYGYGLARGRPEREVKATEGGEFHLSLGQAF